MLTKTLALVLLICSFRAPLTANEPVAPRNGCLVVAIEGWNASTGEFTIIATNHCNSTVTGFALQFACRATDGSVKACGNTTLDFWPSIGLEIFSPKTEAQSLGGVLPSRSSRHRLFIPKNPSAPAQVPPTVAAISYVLDDLTTFGSAEDVATIMRNRTAEFQELKYWLNALNGALTEAKAQNLGTVDISILGRQDRTGFYLGSAQKVTAQGVKKELFSRFSSSTGDHLPVMAKREAIESCLEYIRMRIENGAPHILKESVQ